MPQIKEYTAEATSLRPTETGIDALAQVGRRAGGFYNQAAEAMKGGAEAQARAAGAVATADENVARSVSGIAKSVDEAAKQADDFVTHQEIGHGMTTHAQVLSDLTDQWNDTAKNADPNDVSIAGKFRETVLEPKLEEFTSNFHTTRGQDWANSHADALRTHMFEKQSADMATLAGDAVAVNVRKTTNAWSNTARNDPSSVPFLLQTADASIAGIVSSSPNLKGTEAARVHSQVTQKAKEEIVKAGALGAIEKSGDPEAAAKSFGDRYPEYVNGAEIGQLAKAAKMQARANVLQEKQIQVVQRQIDEQNVKRDSNKSFADNVKFDEATGRPVINPKIIKDAIDLPKNYPNAPNAADHARTIINWTESKQNEKGGADDPATLRDLTDRLFDPTNPTTRVDLMKAQVAGKLSDHKFSTMERLVTELEQGPIKEPVFKNAMEGAKALTRTNPAELGAGQYENFVHDFLPKYLAAKRGNALEPDALDLKNPKSMISRSLEQYKNPIAGALQSSIAAGGGLNFTGSPATGAIKVTTPAEAAALKPGTRYVRPDGQVMTR